MTIIVSGKVIGIQISEGLARKHAKCAKVKKFDVVEYNICLFFD